MWVHQEGVRSPEAGITYRWLWDIWALQIELWSCSRVASHFSLWAITSSSLCLSCPYSGEEGVEEGGDSPYPPFALYSTLPSYSSLYAPLRPHSFDFDEVESCCSHYQLLFIGTCVLPAVSPTPVFGRHRNLLQRKYLMDNPLSQHITQALLCYFRKETQLFSTDECKQESHLKIPIFCSGEITMHCWTGFEAGDTAQWSTAYLVQSGSWDRDGVDREPMDINKHLSRDLAWRPVFSTGTFLCADLGF